MCTPLDLHKHIVKLSFAMNKEPNVFWSTMSDSPVEKSEIFNSFFASVFIEDYACLPQFCKWIASHFILFYFIAGVRTCAIKYPATGSSVEA